METTNLLGITDQAMVDKILAEKPAGGATTLAVYDRYSAFGFSRLKKSPKYAALSDFEKSETAYDAAGRFVLAILEGAYQPREAVAATAFFWTICHRRAVDALRKIKAHVLEAVEVDSNNPAPVTYAFAKRESLNEDLINLPVQSEYISGWLDTQLIWEMAERNLPENCYEILCKTIREDQSQANISQEKGYAPGTLKTLKTRCLRQFRDLVRGLF